MRTPALKVTVGLPSPIPELLSLIAAVGAALLVKRALDHWWLTWAKLMCILFIINLWSSIQWAQNYSQSPPDRGVLVVAAVGITLLAAGGYSLIFWLALLLRWVLIWQHQK